MLLALALLVGTPTGWQLPDQAIQVQVLRNGTTAWVAPSEVQPHERIKACNAELAIGSTTTCPEAGRAPGRNDIWWLKSDVYATPAPSGKVVTVRWNPPRNPDGSEYTDILGYKLTIRRQDCDTSQPGCAVSNATEEVIRGIEARSHVIEGVKHLACATVQAFNDAGDGAVSDEKCGPKKQAPPVVTDFTVE